jgi:type I restriction enzyme S subunit
MNKVFKYIPVTDLLEKIIDNRGKTVPTSEKGIPLIATNCIKHSSIYPTLEKVRYVNEETHTNWFRAHLEPNDILFVNKGTPGRVCLVPNPVSFCAAQDMMAFRCNDDLIDYRYLFAVLRSDEIQKKIENNHVGLVIPHLRKQDLSSILIPIRDRKEQELIGNFYISLSEKIELNNRINSELEAISKTLYDYWFVQFDFPDANGKPYKSTGGKMVYNEKLKREVPDGWEVELYSEWINNDKSGDWGKELPEGNYTEKVYCIRGADINGLNGTGELKSPERYILEKNLHKTLDPADLIVEISGGSPVQSTGRLAFITEGTLERFDAPIICSNFCKAVTLKNKKLLYNFVYHWKSIYDAGVLFGYEGKTSGIKNLLFDSFVSSHYTVVPAETIAEKFYDFMEPIQAKKQKNLKENQELASLRDWLLPMLMNGQVSVGEVIDVGQAQNEELGMVAEERTKKYSHE